MSLGFGIIGCGMISRFHAKALADIDDATLIGCSSRSIESTQRLADETGSKCFQSLGAMLTDDRIDVVTIGTPSGAHLEPALAAISAGKHVIIEKPLEVNPQRCDEIISAAQSQGVVISTIFPSRFHESCVELKRAVDERRFGRLTLGDAYVKWFRTQEYYDSGQWRGTWKLDGGGALMNQAIHSVDLLLWLMGEVTEVCSYTATLAHERIEVEDVVVAAIRFANGALGTIEASTAAYPGSLKKIEIHGTQGSATIEEEDIKQWQFVEEGSRDAEIRDRLAAKTETGGGAADPTAIGHHGHTAQFRDVIEAIQTGRAVAIDGQEGRRSVDVICAIYESAKTGKPIVLRKD